MSKALSPRDLCLWLLHFPRTEERPPSMIPTLTCRAQARSAPLKARSTQDKTWTGLTQVHCRIDYSKRTRAGSFCLMAVRGASRVGRPTPRASGMMSVCRISEGAGRRAHVPRIYVSCTLFPVLKELTYPFFHAHARLRFLLGRG